MPGDSDLIGTITLEFEGGTARLVVRGPEIPVVGARPAMGVSRDDRGRFHFVVGADDYVYNAEDLPGELRRLLGGSSGSARPGTVRIPSCRQLRLSDGSYLTLQQYDFNRRMWHSQAGSIDGVIWPPLPPPIYTALIRSCRNAAASGGGA